ncbi:MAG: hypothetical protein ACRDGV_01250 [Candidatus Limnocylindria bacterium]
MKLTAAPKHGRARVAFWALAGVALLVSHDLVWLAQIGPGEELIRTLRHAGHGYWGLASMALALIGLGVAIGVVLRVRSLRRRADELQARAASIRPRPYLARALAAWVRLLGVVAIGFVIQENVEHFFSHSHVPGLGALLGPEYPLALPVIAGITAFAALLAAAVGSVERELLATITAAIRRRILRPPRRALRPPRRAERRPISPLAAAWAGRAPPRLLIRHS